VFLLGIRQKKQKEGEFDWEKTSGGQEELSSQKLELHTFCMLQAAWIILAGRTTILTPTNVDIYPALASKRWNPTGKHEDTTI
jgi:hypothetical protein